MPEPTTTAATRTAEQQLADMVKYGPCPICWTARTVRLAEHDGISTLSLICPAESSHGATANAATDVPFVNVRKVSHTVQVSRQTLMDYGLIPDDRPPYIPTRRQRFRWWRQERVRRSRMRLASWIAGFDVDERW